LELSAELPLFPLLFENVNVSVQPEQNHDIASRTFLEKPFLLRRSNTKNWRSILLHGAFLLLLIADSLL
jgi:hypothetical protein